MPKEKQTGVRRLERGDRLEITLASDARFVTYRTNEPGQNQGFILPSDATELPEPGIRRLGYFGSLYKNRLVVYESLSPNGIDTKSSNWFAELEAVYSLKYIPKKSGTEILVIELLKQTPK